jgi:hypothetical protein
MAFPKMWTNFNMVLMSKTSFRNWRPPRFGLFYHQAMHLFWMFSQQPLGTICDTSNTNFTFPFWSNLHPFFVFLNHIRCTRKCWWLKGLVSFKFRT